MKLIGDRHISQSYDRPAISRGAGAGLLAGLIGSIFFLSFEGTEAAVTGGSFFAPLHAFAAIPLGRAALSPSYSLVSTIIGGSLTHLTLSLVYGLVFGIVISQVRPLASGYPVTIAAGVIAGLALWVLNFFILAPFFFTWFTQANMVVQFFAHSIFFGLPLGLVVGGLLARRGAMPRRQPA